INDRALSAREDFKVCLEQSDNASDGDSPRWPLKTGNMMVAMREAEQQGRAGEPIMIRRQSERI
ncbi:MAG: hypothetical protein ABF826_12700, partial [Komagataeibacter saccharivorans]|uniref:hypothetical protein n=1 Tax=Komagataeibacter saccharivorans TaxID=265959 RepID=UPI0039ECA5EB